MCSLYVGLEKFSCDLCGNIGSKPTHTVTLVDDKSKMDICKCCYRDSMKHKPFTDGLKAGKIIIREY